MDIFLSSLKLTFETTDDIAFECNSSKLFKKQIIDTKNQFRCFYRIVNFIDLPDKMPDFTGQSFENAQIPYKWHIYKDLDEVRIQILFFENETIKEVMTKINFSSKSISVNIIPCLSNKIVIDPLFYPLGSLLMIYLAHFSQGFLIHASGINDQNKGYIFTGVSGAGKTTMSRLWSNNGATVINDDRLWIQKIENEWKMFSTPMMNYAQPPLMANISRIFLISHSPENHLCKTNGAQGVMKVMTNCIQHLFDKEMTATHLETIFEMAKHIPIYELGFKPTEEVVSFIKEKS